MKKIALPLVLLALSCTQSRAVSPGLKILFVGDSITRHHPAFEKLGWSGNWGMAASTQSNDYVHLFLARIQQRVGTKPVALIEAEGGGTLAGQIKNLDNFVAAQADIAVVQMGENDKEETKELFQKPYTLILEAIRKGNPQAKIYCFAVWSPPGGDPAKDAMIRALCQQYHATFVALSVENQDPLNQARSEKRFVHLGVNWHPGDRGMHAYADALWASYLSTVEKTP